MKKVIIEENIFEKYLDFNRGLIVIESISNDAQNAAIDELLANEIMRRSGQVLVDNEFVKAWDWVYESFGSNPNKYPPSIKSLARRIDKGGKIPFINSVVALFNYISIKYLVPCGGDDTDMIRGNLKLAFAAGNETFTPLGGGMPEKPDIGEIIYFDDASLNVMCRRWNWRNGDFTKIMPETKRIIINVDGISPVPYSLIISARDELAELLKKHCQAELLTGLLSVNNREMEI